MNFKFIFITFLLILRLISIYSQPVFSSGDILPVVGDVHVINICDSVNEGTSGMNQIWNFTSITCPNSYQSKWLSSINSSLPTASMVNVSGFDTSFYDFSANLIDEIAISSQNTGFVPLTNSYIQNNFPISYGSTLTDSFVFSPYIVNSFTHLVSGNARYLVDGFGTIVLPTGTYTDVLRFHQIYIRRDSTVGLSTAIDSTEIFGWLKASNHIGIAWVWKTYSNGSPNPNPYAFSYLNNIVTSDNDITLDSSFELKLYPNPCVNQFYLSSIKPIDASKLCLIDFTGRRILFRFEKLSSNKYMISPIRKLNGRYMFRINFAEGASIYKLVEFVE